MSNLTKLYSLDNFIQAVKQSSEYKDVSKVALAGFASIMRKQDQLYVDDEHIYVDALNKYISK